MLIAMAGLPASGKSTLAEALSAEIPKSVTLNKDAVRSFMFGPHTDYSREQDDLCVDMMYDAAHYLLKKDPFLAIILDGRTYSRTYQIDAVSSAAKKSETTLKIIECVCSEQSARDRLDNSSEEHPAKDRDFQLYLRSKESAQEITLPKKVIETDKQTLDANLAQAMTYLRPCLGQSG